MSDTAVAVDFNKALDVEGNVTAKVTFDNVVVLDLVTQLGYLLFGKILGAGIGIDTGLYKDIVGALAAYTVNVGKGDLDALLIRNINTSYTSQSV